MIATGLRPIKQELQGHDEIDIEENDVQGL